MKDYFLSRTSYCCRTVDGVVLMDLRSGKYLGIDNKSASSLASLIDGWPGKEEGEEEGSFDQHGISLADDLLGRGLLTRDRRLTRANAGAIPTPARRIPHEDVVESTARIAFHHRLRFARAWALTAMSMRYRSLESIVEATRGRKAVAKAFSVVDAEPLARELASSFYRLRPWAYTAHKKCLLDSIVVCEFFAQYGLFPLWVIGVRTQPFQAHSWVQHEDLVLNDTPEHARRYTPVLAV